MRNSYILIQLYIVENSSDINLHLNNDVLVAMFIILVFFFLNLETLGIVMKETIFASKSKYFFLFLKNLVNYFSLKKSANCICKSQSC